MTRTSHFRPTRFIRAIPARVGVVSGIVALAALASVEPLAATGSIVPVSVAEDGLSTASNLSVVNGITPDGNTIVFSSIADDLVPDPGADSGIPLYHFDRISKKVRLVTRAVGAPGQSATPPPGPAPEGFSTEITTARTVSDDGRYVAYTSDATNLVDGVEDSNGNSDVFLWDRATGSSILVSRSSASADKTGDSGAVLLDLSADGRFVLYRTWATDLPGVAIDENEASDLMLFDRTDGTHRLVSHPDGVPESTGSAESTGGRLSADGNWVAFSSRSQGLVDSLNDANGGGLDVFLWSREEPNPSERTRLVSRSTAGTSTTPDSDSQVAAISADGNEVLFHTESSDVEGTTEDECCTRDAFLFDRTSESVVLVSRSAESATVPGNGSVDDTVFGLSADGEYSLYIASSSNVVAGQTDSGFTSDVFLFTRTGSLSQLVSRAASSATTALGGGFGLKAWLSLDGSTVVYSSSATGEQTGVSDSNGTFDLFRWRRVGGAAPELVSHALGTPQVTANSSSDAGIPSRDGSRVALTSSATDLTTLPDGNFSPDVFYSGPEELFTDGFESGSRDRWSNAP